MEYESKTEWMNASDAALKKVKETLRLNGLDENDPVNIVRRLTFEIHYYMDEIDTLNEALKKAMDNSAIEFKKGEFVMWGSDMYIVECKGGPNRTIIRRAFKGLFKYYTERYTSTGPEGCACVPTNELVKFNFDIRTFEELLSRQVKEAEEVFKLARLNEEKNS